MFITDLGGTTQSKSLAIQSLDESLESLANSQSMKMIAQLRWVGILAKRIEHKLYFRSPMQVHKFRDTVFFLMSTIKRSLKKIFTYLALALWGNQIFKKSLLRFFHKVPGLESKLKRIYTSTVYSTSSQDSKRESRKIPDLSPTAHRIYFILKDSINRHHGGDL